MAMRCIERVRFKRVIRPLRTPFSTALGTKTFINNVLVNVQVNGGVGGIGEIPTSFSAPYETVDVIKAVLREAARELFQQPLELYPQKIEEFRRRFPQARMTVSGLEVALFRAHLASHGERETTYWGGSGRSLESDITVPFSSDNASVHRWVNRAAESGFRVFKLKVSGDGARDLSFVCQVQTTLGDRGIDFAPRIDGNQGFSRESLLKFTEALEERGIVVEALEQPLPKDDIEGLAYVARRISTPIILDESVYSIESMKRAIDSGACRGVNIKVAKSGISESLGMIEIARRNGIRLMMGCMMETMVGLSAAIYLASGTGVFDFVDLDSIYFLHHRRRYGDIAVETPHFRIGQA